MSNFKVISPIDNKVYVERPLANGQQISAAVDNAQSAFKHWRTTSIAERAKCCELVLEHLLKNKNQIGEEISRQMGRPISYTPGEIETTVTRGRFMIDIAAESLADIASPSENGFNRFLRREPLGLVFTIAPWNYPFLTAVNSIIPAIMAGNVVLLKHSAQTPLVAERFQQAFDASGIPSGVFQHLHLSHDDTEQLIANPAINYVAFTGSVAGGVMVEKAAVGRFIGCGLELGGKDPAYVRADAPMQLTVETLVDGAFFNSGQACSGIERIYVHKSRYDEFVDAAVALTKQYRLGDPLETKTNLGPMVRTKAAIGVRKQLQSAINAGAKALIDAEQFPSDQADSPYMAPQILVNVDHSMDFMREETFGPAVGIMPVSSDNEAIKLMNDSQYGLTASIFTQDEDAALNIGNQTETGTWFMNRCDFLEPSLAWVGVKNSGRGCSLSRVGYEALTRPKSFHLKTKI